METQDERRDATREARLAELARMPVAHHLGYRVLERSADEAVLAQPARPEYAQVEGVVHGGLLGTLADTAAVYVLYPELPEGTGLTSIEFKLNFLRPALLGRGELRARARLVQRGRTVSLCDVEVEQGDRLVAKGLFTYATVQRG